MRWTYLWLLQLFTGLLILVLVAVNLILIHLRVILRFFGVESPESAIASRASPGVLGVVLVVLAGIVLFHAFGGLRLTMLELANSAKKTRIINRAVLACGAVVIISSVILLSL